MSLPLSGNKWEMAQIFGTIYGEEEKQAILDVLQDGAPTSSGRVREFEKRFAGYVGGRYGVAANSWGGAAHLLAIQMGIKPGDEIIVPAVGMQATANIFVREGAKIVFAEVNPLTFNIDPQKLKEKISSKTRALIVVHLYGQPCDMEPLVEIAGQYGLTLIQDAAHAIGATYHNKRPGEFGDFILYSFHQAKNISTLGEGGMVITNNKEFAIHLKRLRNHGAGLYLGISCRMTDIQAAAGLIQLKRIETLNATRRTLAYYLNKCLSDIKGISTPYEMPHILHVYHLYNILVNEKELGISRDRLLGNLWKKHRIMAITYHPTINCLPAYKKLGHGEGECPVSEEVAAKTIALPISPRFTESDMDELVAGLKNVIALGPH
jgi:dTDP-4-amino-4,6-dideoxygalactose transaminase